MGMDLIAQEPSSAEDAHFHANWTGWGILADLLAELGCDLRQLAGSNDGDLVDAATACSWADAVESGIDRIFIETHADATYAGGESMRLRVAASDTPVLESSSALAARLVRRRMNVAEHSSVPLSVMPLRSSQQDLDWVLSFARFCRLSGGFRQF